MQCLPSVVNYHNLINFNHEKWSLAYRSLIFNANISTTSRAESMNSILKSTLKSTSEFSEIFSFLQRLQNSYSLRVGKKIKDFDIYESIIEY